MNLFENRHWFATTNRWVFLDHAAVAPLPSLTVEAMKEYLDDMAIHGVASFHRWDAKLREVRTLVANLLNADPFDIAFVSNTTAGIGLVAEGFPWKPGDNLITAEEEYPSNQYPWMNLQDKGVEVRKIPSRENRIWIDDIVSAINDRTRLISLSAVQFASGFRSDLPAIGELCRNRGIFFFVDAIQALGVLPFDVSQLPIDALSADGHKWLLGPEGAGIFWLRREWVDRLHPIGVGWNSVIRNHDFNTIDFRLKPHSGRWEGGTYNAVGIIGLGASIQLLLGMGIATIWYRVKHLTDYLCEKAGSYGLEVFSSRREEDKSGIISLIPTTGNAIERMNRCKESEIIINVRSHRLRISPHAYNTIAEIDRFLDCVR
jgi:cysteine desulfurase / selenocysteine lyase